MQKHAFLISGPNASGKTTATQQALAPWVRDDRLLVCYADNSNRQAFKGDQSEIEDRLLEFFERSEPLLVVEGTNRIARAFARVVRCCADRQWEAHVTQVAPQFLRWALERRCQISGKRFRSDYWVDRVLEYEAQRRFATFNTKWLDGQARWWPIGDGYSGASALGDYLRGRTQEILGDPVHEECEDVFQLRP